VIILALCLALSSGAEATAGGFGAAPFQHGTPAPDSLLARAESLLVTGDLPAARRLAERVVDRTPDDVHALIVLGRIHLAWPVVGRFTAESLFARAAELAPGDPEPLYYLGLTGLALKGDDGESIARRGLVRVLAIEPQYRDAWALWLTLYRGERERREAVSALEAHAGRLSADLWRAGLLVELGRDDLAEPLLRDLVRRAPDDPAPRAWLARALFEDGHDREGAEAYWQAVDRAPADTGGVLWLQVRSIASPREREAWEATPATLRPAFLRVFWASREPDLHTRINERLGEHFRRRAQAERYFALLHPNSRYHHSRLWRALSGGVGLVGDGMDAAIGSARAAQCSARLPGVRDLPYAQGLAPSTDTSESETTPNLEDGLDDRGRIFVRQGRPDFRYVFSDGETWCYAREDGIYRVTFIRRTGGWGVSGDMVVTPTMAGERESASILLATDRSDEPRDLSFRFWMAAFRDPGDPYRTILYLLPDSVDAVAALIDAEGREVSRDSAVGAPLRLTAPSDRYLLMLDTRRGRKTGRYRGTVPLARFDGETLHVSSLLLASASVAADRDAMAAAAPSSLRLPANTPLRLYAEVYGAGRRDGVAHYTAEYRFERTDGFILRGRRERVTTIAFRRERPFAPRLIESLVVDPGRLPRGHYRVQLTITDDVSGTRSASALLEFDLR